MPKTLEQNLQEKLIDTIFPSFSEEHQQTILRIITSATRDWLTEKRTQKTEEWRTAKDQVPLIAQNNLLDELLDEVNS